MLKESGETIYLGYSKGDYDRSRPGRVVKDDPSRCECLQTRGLQPDGCAAACWTSGLQALCLSPIASGAGVRLCLISGTMLGVPCAEIRAAVCGLACPGVMHHCTGLPCPGMTISGSSQILRSPPQQEVGLVARRVCCPSSRSAPPLHVHPIACVWRAELSPSKAPALACWSPCTACCVLLERVLDISQPAFVPSTSPAAVAVHRSQLRHVRQAC